MEDALGETLIARAVSGIIPVVYNSDLSATVYCSPAIKTALSVPHRQKPSFKLPKYQTLGIKAVVTSNDNSYTYQNNSKAIPKNYLIDFSLLVPPKLLYGEYIVKWQVVNTGDEARRANDLRGDFKTEVNSTKRREYTKYHGTHYVQAFLIKKGSCIAMSKEFIVNIE